MQHFAKKLNHFERILQSAFDPEAFNNTTFNDANSTRFPVVPEGEYAAIVKKKDWRTTEKGSLILDIHWAIDDQGVKDSTGLAEPTARMSIFIDRTPTGGLDFSEGKNVKLGKLREALGLNQPGQPFSFNMIDGKPARVKVKHRLVDGETFTDVKDVTKL